MATDYSKIAVDYLGLRHPDDLPPESQGLPSDGLYGRSASELARVLRNKEEGLPWYAHKWYATTRLRQTAKCLECYDTVAWSEMPFAVAKAWLLEDLGLTDA